MPAGRPPKPAAMKRTQGTVRNDRPTGLETNHKPVALEEEIVAPVNPDFTPTELEFLGEIMGWLDHYEIPSELDRPALKMMAHQYHVYKTAMDIVLEEGGTVFQANSSGAMVKVINPEVKVMNNAFDRLLKMMQEFGLTPASRVRLAAVKKEEDEFGSLGI